MGLGNPGAKYKYSRHNIGFQVVDKFALQVFGNNLKWKKKFQAHILQGKFQGQDLILIKPQTFMNLSGSSVRDIMAYFHIAPEQLLVIYDDFHLPLGKIRIRKRGSSGGHNGIESIINTLRTEAVSYTHLRAHETVLDLVCRLLLEKKKNTQRHQEKAYT